MSYTGTGSFGKTCRLPIESQIVGRDSKGGDIRANAVIGAPLIEQYLSKRGIQNHFSSVDRRQNET